jgi:hypothetical protein
VTGELVSASLLNTHLRDNLSYIISSSGLLSIAGFGAHALSTGGTGNNSLTVANTTAGTGNYAEIGAVRDGALGLYLQAFSSTWTTAGVNVQSGGNLQSNGSGGLSISAVDAAGIIRFYVGGTTMNAQLYHSAGSSEFVTFSLQGGGFGTGTKPGNRIDVGRNSSGNGAPGIINLNSRNGNQGVIWVDASGNVRVDSSGSSPTESGGDTGGTVVGTQTSTRASKIIREQFTDTKAALRELLNAPLFRFVYTNGAYNNTEFVGITTDDSPTFGMDEGRSFNPVTAFGYTVAAIKELSAKIDRIEKALA